MSSESPTEKRAYDATRRRERAEKERRATQQRVVAAAGRLFVDKGYVATTIAEIAREAGVAVQSVYKAGQSKADLLQLVLTRAVAGDDEEVLVHERPAFAAVAEQPDPVRQVHLIAALIAQVQERSAPLQRARREAAALEAPVAADLEADQHRRFETFRVIVGTVPADRLRASPEDATATAWAIGSPDVFHLLRVIQGWDPARYLDWLERTLVAALLR